MTGTVAVVSDVPWFSFAVVTLILHNCHDHSLRHGFVENKVNSYMLRCLTARKALSFHVVTSCVNCSFSNRRGVAFAASAKFDCPGTFLRHRILVPGIQSLAANCGTP